MTNGRELAGAFERARRHQDWNPLLELLRPSMLRWVERTFPAWLRKRLDPEDVVQAAQWSIYLGLREFQETDPRALRAWTHTLTLRTLRDHVRYHERQRRDVHSDEILVADPRAATKQEADRPWSWRAESVHEALARLPEAERRVVILRHVEGRP
jgi:RNA polymerase sigma factor (sigma-70 family)